MNEPDSHEEHVRAHIIFRQQLVSQRGYYITYSRLRYWLVLWTRNLAKAAERFYDRSGKINYSETEEEWKDRVAGHEDL